MKYLFLIALFCAAAMAGPDGSIIIYTQPSIEIMKADDRVIGVKLREGVIEYKEAGKPVYYVTGKTLKEVVRLLHDE
jgi:hypothetical protein